jgi:hypothetical protein
VTDPASRTPRTFWVGLGAGLLVMGWGVRLYLEATPDLDRQLDLAKWLVGLDLAHDLLLAPAVVGIGYLVRRSVPAGARAAVQAALIATGVILLVGLLPLMGTAGARNPTIQPIRYGPAIAAVIAVIWVGAAVGVLTSTHRLHRGWSRR